jgi:hypothetical protein
MAVAAMAPLSGMASSRVAAPADPETIEEAAPPVVGSAPQLSESHELNGSNPHGDEEGFVWPEGTTEAAVVTSPSVEPREDAAPLPKLEDLVQKLPADTREVLEDLFRVRFVSVKRVPKSALKARPD